MTERQTIEITPVEGEDGKQLAAAVDGILDRTADELGHTFKNSKELNLKAVDAAGRVVGGLVGSYLQGWLYVKLLAVEAETRGEGLGARLLTQAESIARAEGLAGVYLDTFEFQAPRFYLREGYSEIGRLPAAKGQPQRIWFAKTFE